MRRSRSEQRVGVGSSSVLMILVVLAMTALGLLALGSARQTEAHTQRNLQASLGYSGAAARVQQKLADIDEAAVGYARLSPDVSDAAEWFAARDIEGVIWAAEGDVVRFEITEDAGDGRALVASGELIADGKARYRLISHTLTATPDEPGDTIRLMGE